ncbi:MAG: hypothetical protein JXB38_09560 [Anaerolineales bacterium]|nr:hypothetical protein [Anaerolineales bacterium]
MDQNAEISLEPTDFSNIQKNLRLRNQFKNGANWFYWIAGLSVLNSVIFLFGRTVSLMLGLGINQLVDGIAYYLELELGPELTMIPRYIGLGLNLLVAGLFAVCGFYARKKIRWIYILGIGLYIFDVLLLLWLGDFLSVLFHGLALYGLFEGFGAIKQLKELELKMSAEQIEQVIQMASEQPAPTFMKSFVIILLGALAIIIVGTIIMMLIR